MCIKGIVNAVNKVIVIISYLQQQDSGRRNSSADHSRSTPAAETPDVGARGKHYKAF